jgi:hypothetical protein
VDILEVQDVIPAYGRYDLGRALLAGHPFALFAGFRKSNGDRLFATFELATFAAWSAFGGAALIAMHFDFDILTSASCVFAFLRHERLLLAA